MSINPDSTKTSQSSSNFERQPIWLQSFLALFSCDSVPYILFTRVAQPATRWDNAGELVHVDLNCLHLVHPEFEGLLGQPLWSARFANIEDRRSHVEDLIERGNADANGLENTRKGFLLTILTIAASAFPEPWCEVIWRDVEEDLWEVVESTCLPVLGVLDRDDVESFLEAYLSNHRKPEVLFMLITFFIRVSVLLASRTPPNLLELISQSTELFRGYVKIGMDASQEDLDYLLLSKLIADILIDKNQLPMAAGRLHNLSNNGSMRSNAAIGFALGTLPINQMGVVSNECSKWTPILPNTPSTMEVLVQSQLLGTIPLDELFSTGLESLLIRVLMGLSDARKKAFFNAARILEPLIGNVEKVYGKASLELLLIGTTLVNSFNATGREVDGEKLGRYLWSCAFGSFTSSPYTGPKQQTYLMVAISDSFLGQGKYVDARGLLMEVLNRNSSDTNLLMSATLRLLKMSRRERSMATSIEDWTMLGSAVKGFDKLSDILKYECIEETVCRLSILESDQMAKIPGASRIVKTLIDYRLSTYKGSTPSRLNLHRNLEELKRFKNKLSLFSISGPQLSYCRKLRERFVLAPVQIIEKVGSANWQRFKRIKEIREMEVPDEVEPQTLVPAKSTFHDSAVGSSLKMDSVVVPSPLKATRSVTSIRSFMSCEDGEMLLPPLPPVTSTGEQTCYICEKPVIDIENESQWRRHAFSDLRPYVCIVDDCVADHMDFASRVEFAAHLTEHQHTDLWACTQCGQTEEKEYLVRDHISSKHLTGDNENRNVDVIPKSILRDISSQSCPFCGEAPGSAKFIGHLCHHLEEISLSAIPGDVGVGFDEDDEMGSSLGYSPSTGRIEEMFAKFDQPFDEIDVASEATRGVVRDGDIPSTPFPLATTSQKPEHELGGKSKNRVEDVNFQFEKEDFSQAQALDGIETQQTYQASQDPAMQRLLEKAANIETLETEKQTPLYLAAQGEQGDDTDTDATYTPNIRHRPKRRTARLPSSFARGSSSTTTAAATTHTFPCTFAFAGCPYSFNSKNEWKRHVTSKHMCFYYWECRVGSCSPPGQGGRFNRKDLFAQHLRRMHSLSSVLLARDSKAKGDWDRRLECLLEEGRRLGRAPINGVKCPVPGCSGRWEGQRSWEERMEHVARHWEGARGGENGGWSEAGGGLLEWAAREGVIREIAGGRGWVLDESKVGKVDAVEEAE